MGKVTKKEMPIWAKLGHPKPVSRREFLGYGMIPFAVQAFVPGALGLLTSIRANAAELECAEGGGTMPAFITLNLAGGASLISNFLPRDAGGQVIASLSKMGGGTAANIPLIEDLGANNWSGNAGGGAISPFLAGIRAGATQATRDKSAVLGFAVSSQDDTANNKFDASGMIFKAGVVGSQLPNMGTANSVTGVSQRPAMIAPPPPLIVGNTNDIANSIGYTRALAAANGGQLTRAQQEKVSKLVANLSDAQAKKFESISSAAAVKDLVACAGIKNIDMVKLGAAAIDPLTQNAAVATLWGFTAATATNNQNRVFGTMVYNAIAGNAGTVNLNRGGYDYHDGTRATGNTRDQEAGLVVGRILETAAILNKKVVIYVTSDGSTVSPESANPGAIWTSDRGDAGCALMFTYDPAGRTAMTGLFVGNYTAGQVADSTSPIGSNPEVAAQAVLANYLQFAKKPELLKTVVPGSTLDASALAKVIKVV